MAAFAAAGLRIWRTKPVAVGPFLNLPAVQGQLAKIDAGDEPDADAQQEAVVLALKAALRHLPEPFYSAARDHFGFSDSETDQKAMGKVEREEKAARHLGRTTQRWYFEKGRSPDYQGRTPSEYIIALVTAALCGSSDPVTFLVERQRSSAPPAGSEPGSLGAQQTQSRFITGRARLVAAGVAVSLLVAAIAWSALGSGSGRGRGYSRSYIHGIPPRGWVVNAGNGRVSPPNSLPSPPKGSAENIGGGNIFRGCNATTTNPCSYLSSDSVDAQAGDVLRFRLRLQNAGSAPASEVKLLADVYPEGDVQKVGISIELPGGPNASGPSPSIEEITSSSVAIHFSDGQLHALEYVSGSSLLYDSSEEDHNEGHILTHLPDGIVSFGGVTLTNIGAPPGCWDCERAYIRYVDFSLRVSAAPSPKGY